MGAAEEEGNDTFLPRLGVGAKFTTVRRGVFFFEATT